MEKYESFKEDKIEEPFQIYDESNSQNQSVLE